MREATDGETGVFNKGESAMDAEPTTESLHDELYGDFDKLNDEEILLRIKDKNDKVALDYLINKYRNFVRAKARSYFLIGADREDIIQEGMIGFYKAIRDFRNDKLSSFRAFAELCVTRQIITAIKTATRQKHIPLNSYISLNKPIYDEDSARTLLDVLSGAKAADPEELVISRPSNGACEIMSSTIYQKCESECSFWLMDNGKICATASWLNDPIVCRPILAF